MSDYGRERITVLELDVPLCQLEYGTTNGAGTCNAILGAEGQTFGSPPVTATGQRKCFNTRVTCQDPDNYNPATQVIRFARPQRGLEKHYDNIFPCMMTANTTPGAVNLGGMDRNQSALGAREAVDVTLEDFRWNDVLFDKYRLERKSGAAQVGTGTTETAVNRFRLPAVGSPEVAPAIQSYTHATTVSRRRLAVSDASALTNSTINPDAADHLVAGDTFHAQFVSEPLGVNAFGVGDAFKMSIQASEVFLDNNLFVQVFIGLVSNDGSTALATLRSKLADNTEISGLIATSRFISSTLTGAYTTTGGERLVVEISLTGTPVASPAVDGHNGTIRFGSSGTSGDLPETDAETGTTFNPWIEFATAVNVLTVAYDPYTRGTFWGKFLARNPYYANYRARIKQGFLGDALTDMTTRNYIVDRVTGPSAGKVQISLKDIFSLIEERKSVAPFPSQGELLAAITGSPATFTVSPSGIGDLTPEEGGYSTISPPGSPMLSGFVLIGDEAIEVTRSGDVFTVITRGALNTTSDDHSNEDLVQLVLVMGTDQAHEHIYTLLTEYSGITAAEIPKSEWDILAASMPELYATYLTAPTPVRELIGELCEQAGCTVWADPETALIEFRPLRPQAANVTVTDNEWIIDKSLTVRRQDTKRVSRALVYYGQKNPTVSLDERKNFRSRVITIDLDAESETEYGVPAMKEIFSRWIPQFGSTQATDAGERIISLFRNPPLEAAFRLYASREGELLIAEPFYLQTFDAQDDTGDEEPELMAPIQIGRGENELEIKAQGVKFYTTPGDPSARTIYLDSTEMRNLNLRTVHDSIYAAPVGIETVTFIIPQGFTVGSVSTSMRAITTGSWPDGVVLSLENSGRIQGMGGAGGQGVIAATFLSEDGFIGGDALEATYAISVDNTGGEIWAGGGGGGGAYDIVQLCGGGGGAGTDGGTGGPGSETGGLPSTYYPGSDGTTDAGGAGGTFGAVSGGTGGGPGLAGSAGSGAATNPPFSDTASGGTFGRYIVGNSFVTWVANGDRRGGVA